MMWRTLKTTRKSQRECWAIESRVVANSIRLPSIDAVVNRQERQYRWESYYYEADILKLRENT